MVGCTEFRNACAMCPTLPMTASSEPGVSLQDLMACLVLPSYRMGLRLERMAVMPALGESLWVATGSKMRAISPVRPLTGEATREPVDSMRCVVEICSMRRSQWGLTWMCQVMRKSRGWSYIAEGCSLGR